MFISPLVLTFSSIIAEAQRQFGVFASGDESAIHPSLRSAVFQIAIRYGGATEYKALKNFWMNTTSVDGTDLSLRALGRLQDPSLLPDFLDFLFATVAEQDMHTGAAALAANPKTRLGLWKYIQANFEEIKSRLSKNMSVLDRFLKTSLQKFADFETEKEIAAFFEGKDNRGYDRTLGIVSDTIKGRAGYRERDRDVLLEWLKVNKYA